MSSANVCTSNITSGFIDLATYDELEKYCYGGPSATAYFVRETRKSTWFTLVPVVLSRSSGQGDFGTDHSVTISRAGDYLLATWLRVQIPAITAAQPSGQVTNINQNYIGWTPNLMHNLIAECCITFNDLSAARFDNYHLDFWAAFTVPAGKQHGYNNMIGNIPDLVGPCLSLPSAILNLPLPFWYSRDSGVALPTAALPYNEMRITYSFRNWSDLLVLYQNDPTVGVNKYVPKTTTVTEQSLTTGTPHLTFCQTWANYAIVSNDERKRMACAPRNILIEQCQTAPLQTFNPVTNPTPSYDLRFSHAIKVLFFACRNNTIPSLWSNYTTQYTVYDQPAPSQPCLVINQTNPIQSDPTDPIINTSLTYENTARLANMGSDYYSLVQPWYHAPVIPLETGLHMYSYSLDFICLDPKGSTNYGKLTNVSIAPVASDSAKLNAASPLANSTVLSTLNSISQTFRFATTVVNNNIIRISGGALGFPVL